MLSASTLQHIRGAPKPSRYRTTDRFLSRQNEQDKQDATQVLKDSLQANLPEGAPPLRILVNDATKTTSNNNDSSSSSFDNIYISRLFTLNRKCIIATMGYIVLINIVIVGTLVVQKGIRTHQWNFSSMMSGDEETSELSSFSEASRTERFATQKSLRGYQTTEIMIHLLLAKEVIPSLYQDNLQNAADGDVMKFPKSIPYQWYIPESGGYLEDSFSTIFGTCMGIPQAGQYFPTATTSSSTNGLFVPTSPNYMQHFKSNISNNDIDQPQQQKTQQNLDSITTATTATTRPIEIVETLYGPHLNVDLHTPQGLERMHAQGILLNQQLSSNIILSSPLLDIATQLLFQETNHQGRMYAIFSNPIERTISYFHSNTRSPSSTTFGSNNSKDNPNFDPSFLDREKIESLEQYANCPQDRVEFNWLTKTLVAVSKREAMMKNRDEGASQIQLAELPTSDELTDHDLRQAKTILARKCLILLKEEHPQVSWNLLQRYLDIPTNHPQQGQCIKQVLNRTPANKNHDSQQKAQIRMRNHDLNAGAGEQQQKFEYDPQNPIHAQLAERNVWDMQLYAFILELYDHQQTELLGR